MKADVAACLDSPTSIANRQKVLKIRNPMLCRKDK